MRDDMAKDIMRIENWVNDLMTLGTPDRIVPARIAKGKLIPEKTVVEPGSLWMGSPGKFRRKLEEKDQESILRYARNYLGYTEEYLRER